MLFTICLFVAVFHKKPDRFVAPNANNLLVYGFISWIYGEAVRSEMLWIILTFSSDIRAWTVILLVTKLFLPWLSVLTEWGHGQTTAGRAVSSHAADCQHWLSEEKWPQHRTQINYAQQKHQSLMGLWHSQTWLVAMFSYIYESAVFIKKKKTTQ